MSETKTVFLTKNLHLNLGSEVRLFPGPGPAEVPVEYLSDPDSDMYAIIMAHTNEPVARAPKEGTPEAAEYRRKAAEKKVLFEEFLASEATRQMKSPPKRGR
jgi:hypothetical protein